MTLEKVDWLFNKSWMGKVIHSQGGLKFRIPVTVGLLFLFLDVSGAQEPLPSQTPPPSASRPYITQDGLTLEKLIESANSRRADLLAARQRILIAQGRLTQSALRPNPALETDYGSPRFLGGEPESDDLEQLVEQWLDRLLPSAAAQPRPSGNYWIWWVSRSSLVVRLLPTTHNQETKTCRIAQPLMNSSTQ